MVGDLSYFIPNYEQEEESEYWYTGFLVATNIKDFKFSDDSIVINEGETKWTQ